jgi:hypothetical protein
MRLRFSIATGMVVVLIAAIVLAAWRMAGPVAANIFLNLTVAVLIFGTYRARSTPGRAGAWWSGFATLGWTHLVVWLAGMPWGQGYGFPISLITDVVFWILAANVGPEQLASNLRVDPPVAVARTVILQCLTSLIVGLLGAWAFSLAALAASVPREAGPEARPDSEPDSPRGPSAS